MFSLDVVDTDKFLDMPATTQALYFHLGMRADDDGFVASPKKIAVMCNCSSDDIKILVSKGYAIPFEDGVIVIKHWLQQNKIRKDRYQPTKYQKEFNSLSVLDGVYSNDGNNIDVNQMSTKCLTNVNQMSDNPHTQYRTEQYRTGQYSIVQDRTETDLYGSDSGSDTYTLEEIFKIARDGKVNISDEGIRSFFNQIREDGWTMYGRPIDNILRAIREYAKKHQGDDSGKAAQCTSQPKRNGFHNFDQREYDFDDLEKQLSKNNH